MSEELKERKKKTTKTAKLFGFLLVPSITTLIFLMLWGFYEILPHSVYTSNGKFIVIIIRSLLILSFLLSIGFGIKLASKWDKLKRGKKNLLGFLIFIPAYVIALLWINHEFLDDKKIKLFEINKELITSHLKVGEQFTARIRMDGRIKGIVTKIENSYELWRHGTFTYEDKSSTFRTVSYDDILWIHPESYKPD